MKETQTPKWCHVENPERKERTSSLNEPELWGMVNLIKWVPKEKTGPRGKRQLLIMVLSEIRHVSFYQRVMEIQ